MNEVLVVSICELLGGVVADFGQDNGGKARGVGGACGGVFGQDGVVMRDAGVEERSHWGGGRGHG